MENISAKQRLLNAIIFIAWVVVFTYLILLTVYVNIKDKNEVSEPTVTPIVTMTPEPTSTPIVVEKIIYVNAIEKVETEAAPVEVPTYCANSTEDLALGESMYFITMPDGWSWSQMDIDHYELYNEYSQRVATIYIEDLMEFHSAIYYSDISELSYLYTFNYNQSFSLIDFIVFNNYGNKTVIFDLNLDLVPMGDIRANDENLYRRLAKVCDYFNELIWTLNVSCG